MAEIREINIKNQDSGKRIDIAAAETTGISRSKIQRLIKDKAVSVNSRPVVSNYRLQTGDIVSINIPEEKETTLVPEDLPIKIIHKDDYVVVCDKPPGMVVYPAPGHNSGTLMNAVLFHCKKLANIGCPLRPGVVHRLDKDTSGVMVIALNDRAYYSLAEQFKNRTIEKIYIALVYGNIKGEQGEINLSIGRSESDRKKMSTRARKWKEALTSWKVLERFGNAALVEATIKTGRTHQIRVHFASIGHPVLGDSTYGKKLEIDIPDKGKIVFSRQMLHAAILRFKHPFTSEILSFQSDIPEDMNSCIEKLRG
ncbi:MAG: RluA family pseudouridine synthase [Nitrospiraceae bacterium]|nr:RluA family pseudouridine synthase [Nitrospiraceae bacterium]